MQTRWNQWKLGALCLFILLSVSMLAAQKPVQISGEDSTNDLAIAVGKTVLINVAQPIQRVAIGAKEIAEVVATSPTEVMINGKAAGQTSLILWSKNGDRRFFTVTVRRNRFDTEDRIDGVRRELTQELSGQAIQVRSENGSIFLSGKVKTLEDSDRAVQIATTALAAQDKGSSAKPKVVNLLYVQVPEAEKQILLKVRFASIDRSKAKNLGINLFSLGLGNTIGGISTGQFTAPTISNSTTTSSSTGVITSGTATATLSNQLNGLFYFPGLKAGADLEALETTGIVQVLAEPNLVATNGKQASFLAGGEYPFPVVQGSSSGSGSTITIQWKEYGVRLTFIPLITSRGTIRLQVSPEVSALDTADAVEVDGYSVPALTVRRVKTEAELANGESIVIGGLLDNRETETFESIPYISNIPVLGKFFQSKSKTRTNTELIVSVTPEIVNPAPAGKKLPELNFPSPFLNKNTKVALQHPEDAAAGVEHPESVPVEKLIDNIKQEKELKMTEETASRGGASNNNETSSSGASGSGTGSQPQ